MSRVRKAYNLQALKLRLGCCRMNGCARWEVGMPKGGAARPAWSTACSSMRDRLLDEARKIILLAHVPLR